MLNPFLFMAAFYLVVAVVGLPWLRVYFVTLGVLTQAAFGALPAFVANRRGAEAPATRWDIWLLLNSGLVLLLAGMPGVNVTLIIAGGTLVFTAVTLLILQLRGIGSGQQTQGNDSLKFYLMATHLVKNRAVCGEAIK